MYVHVCVEIVMHAYYCLFCEAINSMMYTEKVGWLACLALLSVLVCHEACARTIRKKQGERHRCQSH